MNFKENVISSFKKVKETLSDMDRRITTLEAQIRQVQTTLDRLLQQRNTSQNSQISEFSAYKPSTTKLQKSSTGNEGVPSTLQQRFNNASTTLQQPASGKLPEIHNLNDVQILKKELLDRFLHLTDAEFKVFLTIYRLEEESNSPVTYTDISKTLNISRASVRGYVSDLLIKKIPLTKQHSSNRTVYLSIDKAFKNLKMLENLLTLREKEFLQPRSSHDLRKYLDF
jgi:predicted transcriptional regulator